MNRRNRKQTQMRGYTEVKVYKEPGDQSVTFRDIFTLENVEEGTGGTGVYIHGYTIVKPYKNLQQSSYSGFLNTYDLVRVKRYNVKLHVPAATMSLGGLTASKLYRDSRSANPNPFYEGLSQERLVKRGKMWTVYSWSWKPIEPSDFDFLPVNGTILDNGRYGQVNWAAIGVPAPYNISQVPILELTISLDFKYLRNPIIPKDISIRPTLERQLSDTSSIVTVESSGRDLEIEHLKSMVQMLSDQLRNLRP